VERESEREGKRERERKTNAKIFLRNVMFKPGVKNKTGSKSSRKPLNYYALCSALELEL